MGAEVIYLDEYRSNCSASADAPRICPQPAPNKDEFYFWAGVSGRQYVHTVYDLVSCPEIPPSTYVLVRRDQSGRRRVLSVGGLQNDASSLNLAELRLRGARLGANEVHVHYLAETGHKRRMVELDLRAGHQGEVVDELRSGTCH